MNIEEIRKNVMIALENVGIFVDVNVEENIELSNFIEDSIQFISMIVQFEELFCIEIPDELLTIDEFNFIEKVYTVLDELINQRISSNNDI